MNLLASYAWIADLVFILLLVAGILLGAWRGFVAGVCKLAGTIVAVLIALSFCNVFKNSLESWFGLTTALTGAVGEKFAGWISIAISFAVLFAVVKLTVWLLEKLGSGLIERSQVFSKINRFLGGLLGLAEAAVVIFLILSICYWIDVEAVNTFLSESTIVSAIYNWEWFVWAAEFHFLR